jgi:hypothetical protein
MRPSAFTLLAFAALAACAPLPEVDDLDPENGLTPQLEPIDDLLAQAGAATQDPGPALAARAARLKARAAALTARAP